MKKIKKLLYGLIPLPFIAVIIFIIIIFLKDIIWVWNFNFNFWNLLKTNIVEWKLIMLVFFLTIIFYIWYEYLILFKFKNSKKIKFKASNLELNNNTLNQILIILKEINNKLEPVNKINNDQNIQEIIDQENKN